MSKRLQLPSAKYLHTCFTYNSKTGVVRWKRRPRHHFVSIHVCKTWNTRFAGESAGWFSEYQRVTLDGNKYRLHRIIWKMKTGKNPVNTIDHKDTKKRNNQWINLREANETEQRWNTPLLKTNTSGYRGVSLDRGKLKWRAYITIKNKQHFLGWFDTAKKANKVRRTTSLKLYGVFHHDL